MENKILVIDNYDSFTYNLVHYLVDLGAQLEVFRNDQIDIDYIEKFEKILLSPGPGIPSESGLLNAIIKKYHKTKNFLGVCLGHQAIAEVLGCKLINLDTVYHGISTEISILDNEILFKDIPNNLKVGRYHSWVVEELNENFILTAKDIENNVMAYRHKIYKLWGVQFHPESILTEHGKKILFNWLKTK